MKQAYIDLLNERLQQYHCDTEELRTASAVAEGARQFSQNDRILRLCIAIECLQGFARFSGDQESAADLESLVYRCIAGDVPQPFCVDRFAA